VMNRTRERGFSLIEGMVVIAIIGLMALIAGLQIANFVSKSNLEGAANEVRTFLESAKSLMVKENTPITVRYVVVGTEPTLQLMPTAGGPLRTLALPAYVKVAVNPGGLAPASWPTPAAGNLFICDTQGRTLGATGSQVTGVQTISFTHKGMVGMAGYSSVTPRMRYDVQLFPLWTVNVSKRTF
jgi:prepilin-type N-terminal cleavage/methylation domain-containing protein